MTTHSLEDLELFNVDPELLRLCMDLTVYWSGSVFERVDGVMDFYAQVLSLIRKQIRYYVTDTMEGGEEVDQFTFGLLPSWLDKAETRDLYILSLEGGNRKDTLSDTGFYFCADESTESRSGALRLLMPTTYAANPQHYVDLALSLVRSLDFHSGHGGFTLNWFPTAETSDEASSLFPMIARRYPGVDIPDLDITLYAIGTANTPGIKCVNWITLLGTKLVDSVGGIDAIRHELPPECPIYPAGKGGLLIQAGEKPSIGDRHRNEVLTAYASVGSVLAPIRMREHPDFIGVTPASPNEDLTQEWLGRFD